MKIQVKESEKKSKSGSSSFTEKETEKKTEAATALASASRKNRTNNVLAVLEKSNGDMMKLIQLMMMQRQLAMEEEAAERRAEREHHECERELEEMQKMDQFMQMAFTAFMIYNFRSANPSMFPTLTESDDENSDKKPSCK